MALEHTMMLLAVREWATEIFKRLEATGGLDMVDNGGAADANKMRRGAAGLLLKIEEIRERWGRSMISL